MKQSSASYILDLDYRCARMKAFNRDQWVPGRRIKILDDQGRILPGKPILDNSQLRQRGLRYQKSPSRQAFLPLPLVTLLLGKPGDMSGWLQHMFPGVIYLLHGSACVSLLFQIDGRRCGDEEGIGVFVFAVL